MQNHRVILDSMASRFDAYLVQLSNEISAYPDEESIWVKGGTISNTAGNLALHILGNLNHFIGSVMGATGYVRDRPLEFSSSFKARKIILEEIGITREMIRSVLSNMDEATLYAVQNAKVFGDRETTNAELLVHVLLHLGYHTGQINYHRRILA